MRRITATLRGTRRVRVGFSTRGATHVRIVVRSGRRTLSSRLRRLSGDGAYRVTLRFRRRVGRNARVRVEVRVSGPNGKARKKFTYRL